MKSINALRKQCLKLMLEQGLTKRGGQTYLAQQTGLNRNQISMALSGYRNTQGSINILTSLVDVLKNGSGAE